MKFKHYKFIVNHDKGKDLMTIYSTSEKQARKSIMDIELCPARSIKRYRRTHAEIKERKQLHKDYLKQQANIDFNG